MHTLRIRTIRPSRALRAFSTTSIHLQASPVPSLSYTQTCPSPTCACEPSPALPDDLKIDHKARLLHTMALYSSQVLISTGKPDWESRIEDEQTPSGDFIRGLKGVIGRGGSGFDPFNNVSITASSLPESQTPDTTSALLFPAFKRINSIPHDASSIDNFATAYLKARNLHPAHSGLTKEQRAKLTRDESAAEALPPAETITTPTILICGHGGRDARCGILGPVLQAQFQRELERRGIEGEVGLISHIGGHKYAGNVIIYLPPGWEGGGSGRWEGGEVLQGAGIWYGRVGPEQVEGLVKETIVKGRLVVDALRGGITMDGGSIARILEEQINKEQGNDGSLKLRPKPRAKN